MNNRSEWDSLANFLSDMIIKYSEVLDIDNISNLKLDVKETNVQKEEMGSVKEHIVEVNIA